MRYEASLNTECCFVSLSVTSWIFLSRTNLHPRHGVSPELLHLSDIWPCSSVTTALLNVVSMLHWAAKPHACLGKDSGLTRTPHVMLWDKSVNQRLRRAGVQTVIDYLTDLIPWCCHWSANPKQDTGSPQPPWLGCNILTSCCVCWGLDGDDDAILHAPLLITIYGR